MSIISLLVYFVKLRLWGFNYIGTKTKFLLCIDEMNSLYMQYCLLLHDDDISRIDLHVVLRYSERLNGLLL